MGKNNTQILQINCKATQKTTLIIGTAVFQVSITKTKIKKLINYCTFVHKIELI